MKILKALRQFVSTVLMLCMLSVSVGARADVSEGMDLMWTQTNPSFGAANGNYGGQLGGIALRMAARDADTLWGEDRRQLVVAEFWDIITNYHKLIDEFFLVWQYHFEFLNLGYGGYITFFQFCKTAFPLIEDQQIARMVAGVEVMAFDCHRDTFQ